MREFGIYFMNGNGSSGNTGIVKELFETQREASKRAKELSQLSPAVYYTVFQSKVEWHNGKVFKE